MSALRAKRVPNMQRGERKLCSKIITSASDYKTEMTNFLQNSGQVKKLNEIPEPEDRKSRRRAIRKLELFDRKQTRQMLQTEKSYPAGMAACVPPC